MHGLDLLSLYLFILRSFSFHILSRFANLSFFLIRYLNPFFHSFDHDIFIFSISVIINSELFRLKIIFEYIFSFANYSFSLVFFNTRHFSFDVFFNVKVNLYLIQINIITFVTS